jgi:histone H1/5
MEKRASWIQTFSHRTALVERLLFPFTRINTTISPIIIIHLSLLHRKTSTVSIMSYKAGIVDAIQELGDRSGSSSIAIRKVMQSKLPKGKKWQNTTYLTALKTGVANGDFVQNKNSYKLSAEYKKKLAKSAKAAPAKKKAAPKKKAPATKKKTTAAKKKTAPKKKATTTKKKTPAKKKTTTTKEEDHDEKEDDHQEGSGQEGHQIQEGQEVNSLALIVF